MHKTLSLLSFAAVSSIAFSEPLTLRQAIEKALAQNQAVAISGYSREIAAGNLTAARGLYDPLLSFERSQSSDRTPIAPGAPGSANWQDDYRLALSGNTPWGATYSVSASAATFRGPAYHDSQYTSANTALSVKQPLLRGFGFGSGMELLRLAKADKRIADWQYELSVIDTITDVVSLYSDVLETRELLRISEGYRDAVRQLGTDHERRLEIGALAEADVANAQSRAAQTEESVQFARQTALDAEKRFLRLLGEPIDTEVPLELAPLPLPDELKLDVHADLVRAIATRPDVLAARQGLVKAKTIQAARRMDLLPRVDLVGSIGYGDLDLNYAKARDSVLDRENRLYSAGVVVSVPLTHATERGRHRAAKAAVRLREEEISALEADVAVTIDRIARFIETARDRVLTLERAEKLARRSVDAEEKRFRAGTGNTFFVLQQQGELAGVESNLTRARGDLIRARAFYDRETVRTLERFGVTLTK
ncbi:MAG: TolC family protein [Opitutaceae bacterium]|nr:TolC family protein [Opitutaceae bacterium]